ncbi:MAG: hypothetical protein NWF06_04090 [Candidatus Bathyarchaeota archaeon]|nr:hypothetical protein [Candidatus Bathyarchaeum sp.]
MNLKNSLKSLIRGWLPKESNMPKGKLKMAESKGSKPRWWKPYWIITAVMTLILCLALPFFTGVTMERAVIGLVATFLCMGFAYYIRVRPSFKVNRALFILLGITPLGFVLWVICIYVLNRTALIGESGTWPIAVLCFVVCFGLGALIGDWIGKKRHYILPMTP